MTRRNARRGSLFGFERWELCFLSGLICSSNQNKVFLPFEQPLLHTPFFFGHWGWSYPLELSRDTAFICHQHPCSAHWTPMRPNKLVPVRMRPSLEYHLHFTHCYHPELPHMVIQKTLCVALVYQHIIFISSSSSSSLSLPTALLSLSLFSILSPSPLSLCLTWRLKMTCFFQQWRMWQKDVSVSFLLSRGRPQGRKFGHSG